MRWRWPTGRPIGGLAKGTGSSPREILRERNVLIRCCSLMPQKLNAPTLREYLRAQKAVLDSARHTSSVREQVRQSRETIDSSRELLKRLNDDNPKSMHERDLAEAKRAIAESQKALREADLVLSGVFRFVPRDR